MGIEELCSSSRVVIVAGKGGVGKTTVAASLALAAAAVGRTALLVEVEGRPDLAAVFGKDSLSGEELAPGVWGSALHPDLALLEYLETRGLGRISKRLVSSGALEVLATAVPGAKDILLLGKIKALQNLRSADVIIVDAPATGHAVSFLVSPRGLLDAIRVGPIRAQATDVIEMLSDPLRCVVLLVTAPEETPVSEAIEAASALESRAGVTVSSVVVNGLYPELPPTVEPPFTVEQVIADARQAGHPVTEDLAAQMAGADAFRRRRRELQDAQLVRLTEELDLPQVPLPYLFRAQLGVEDLKSLASGLISGLERVAVPRPA
ncbi:MAG: ArsA family ATPase [Acidimicrobiia bacterium]